MSLSIVIIHCSCVTLSAELLVWNSSQAGLNHPAWTSSQVRISWWKLETNLHREEKIAQRSEWELQWELLLNPGSEIQAGHQDGHDNDWEKKTISALTPVLQNRPGDRAIGGFVCTDLVGSLALL